MNLLFATWLVSIFKLFSPFMQDSNLCMYIYWYSFLCRTIQLCCWPCFLSAVKQISKASLAPESTYIAKPAASWLDDFLVWLSPEAFGCCRKFVNGSYCPPDDQVGACSCQIVDTYYSVLLAINVYPSYFSPHPQFFLCFFAILPWDWVES